MSQLIDRLYPSSFMYQQPCNECTLTATLSAM